MKLGSVESPSASFQHQNENYFLFPAIAAIMAVAYVAWRCLKPAAAFVPSAVKVNVPKKTVCLPKIGRTAYEEQRADSFNSTKWSSYTSGMVRTSLKNHEGVQRFVSLKQGSSSAARGSVSKSSDKGKELDLLASGIEIANTSDLDGSNYTDQDVPIYLNVLETVDESLINY